ncbi:uncharacterized protein LOC128333057 [Hemicordylus capensis]|uniref:uncharacterized protein LOC128333057 n=1 Tax=Hemicordylus capensis TaxID=884348 RepID=UPI0023040D17|nr:uncharacterized protein LOC128333057 [Hemicordylus capensis]
MHPTPPAKEGTGAPPSLSTLQTTYFLSLHGSLASPLHETKARSPAQQEHRDQARSYLSPSSRTRAHLLFHARQQKEKSSALAKEKQIAASTSAKSDLQTSVGGGGGSLSHPSSREWRTRGEAYKGIGVHSTSATDLLADVTGGKTQEGGKKNCIKWCSIWSIRIIHEIWLRGGGKAGSATTPRYSLARSPQLWPGKSGQLYPPEFWERHFCELYRDEVGDLGFPWHDIKDLPTLSPVTSAEAQPQPLPPLPGNLLRALLIRQHSDISQNRKKNSGQGKDKKRDQWQ